MKLTEHTTVTSSDWNVGGEYPVTEPGIYTLKVFMFEDTPNISRLVRHPFYGMRFPFETFDHLHETVEKQIKDMLFTFGLIRPFTLEQAPKNWPFDFDLH